MICGNGQVECIFYKQFEVTQVQSSSHRTRLTYPHTDRSKLPFKFTTLNWRTQNALPMNRPCTQRKDGCGPRGQTGCWEKAPSVSSILDGASGHGDPHQISSTLSPFILALSRVVTVPSFPVRLRLNCTSFSFRVPCPSPYVADLEENLVCRQANNSSRAVYMARMDCKDQWVISNKAHNTYFRSPAEFLQDMWKRRCLLAFLFAA
jgi:hypothetical protein